MRTLRPWYLVLLMAVAFAGCGGSQEEKPPEAKAIRGEEPPKTSGGKTVRVKMENEQYKPKRLRLPPGSTVIWENTDDVPHTVTKEGPGAVEKFDSNDIQPGGRYKKKFTRTGEVRYFCRNHYQQAGNITIR